MEKRYQVFVSSTFEDLQEERKEVMQALLELDCIPAGMELFPASNEDQWTLIKRVIDDCDYYLLIIGGRYGSCNSEGISYTQMEFDYALETGKPIISFLPKVPEEIPSGKTEKKEDGKRKLEEFKERAKKKLVKYWSNPQDLGGIVSRSVIKLIKNFPATGWIKADAGIDENSAKEILRLQKENDELKAQILSFGTLPPKGTDDLAQGDDYVKVRFSCAVTGRTKAELAIVKEMQLTWNRIFSAVAPVLINECSVHYMKQALNNLLESMKNEIVEGGSVSKFEISRESFNTIKIQLKALGLITLSEKKKSVKNNGYEYWTLTEYGEYFMTKTMAIKKQNMV